MSVKVIWKFEVHSGLQVIKMPKGASPLHVGIDGGYAPSLWALCETEAPSEDRRILLVPTGLRIPREDNWENLAFIGTIIEPGSGLVWHVFEEKGE